jgi:hypothetical protein
MDCVFVFFNQVQPNNACTRLAPSAFQNSGVFAFVVRLVVEALLQAPARAGDVSR